MDNITKNSKDYLAELKERSRHSVKENRLYLKEVFSAGIKHDYLAKRKEPLSSKDMEEINTEIERWFSCKIDEPYLFNEDALEAIWKATDCTNPNAALVLAEVAINPYMGNARWELLDGLFLDLEFVLHANYRGNAEKELFWNMYDLSNRKISTPDAIRLTEENGAIFLDWLISLDVWEVLENQDEFGAFIKNSKWNEWTEDVMWKM